MPFCLPAILPPNQKPAVDAGLALCAHSRTIALLASHAAAGCPILLPWPDPAAAFLAFLAASDALTFRSPPQSPGNRSCRMPFCGVYGGGGLLGVFTWVPSNIGCLDALSNALCVL